MTSTRNDQWAESLDRWCPHRHANLPSPPQRCTAFLVQINCPGGMPWPSRELQESV